MNVFSLLVLFAHMWECAFFNNIISTAKIQGCVYIFIQFSLPSTFTIWSSFNIIETFKFMNIQIFLLVYEYSATNKLLIHSYTIPRDYLHSSDVLCMVTYMEYSK